MHPLSHEQARLFLDVAREVGTTPSTSWRSSPGCARVSCWDSVGMMYPKIVQEMLGQATITQTIDTYSHVLHIWQDGAVSAMQEAFS